ncbi:MAG: hypothetical protein M3042_03320 [Actinomycetota bacterium]|nr:hypothetical protein [Actinomycetota bacterium]
MRRLFWAALGATVGILVMRKLTRTARALTPAGLAESVSQSAADMADSIREFVTDVRTAMAEREQELMAALTDDGTDLGAMPPREPG